MRDAGLTGAGCTQTARKLQAISIYAQYARAGPGIHTFSVCKNSLTLLLPKHFSK